VAVKIRTWGSKEIDALRLCSRLRPAGLDNPRRAGESAGAWHARITRVIVAAVQATASQLEAAKSPRIGGNDGVLTALTQLYRNAVKLHARADDLATSFSREGFRASPLAHPNAGFGRHVRGFSLQGVWCVRRILHRRVKSLARAIVRARRREGKHVLARLEEADKIADDSGKAHAINLALRRSRPRGGSCVADVYIGDDPHANPIPLLTYPANARAELERIGELAMAAMRGEGFHAEAHEAWLTRVLTGGASWPEMTLDGKPWDVLDALSDERLEAMLRKTPSKAVGADGFDVTCLAAKDADGRVVPEKIRLTYFASLRACAAERSFPPDEFTTIIYVLLPKPGADPRVLQERREIALFSTSQKLLLKTCVGGLNDQIQSQLAPEQLGWTQAHGAMDAAILFTALHDQALGRPGVAILLFLDLKQFFLRIPPEGIMLGAILCGLPPAVQHLAARDFAVMKGRYESQNGLGEPFTIDWGALMGCVLSTQKARIMLNSLVEAILQHVHRALRHGTARGDRFTGR